MMPGNSGSGGGGLAASGAGVGVGSIPIESLSLADISSSAEQNFGDITISPTSSLNFGSKKQGWAEIVMAALFIILVIALVKALSK